MRNRKIRHRLRESGLSCGSPLGAMKNSGPWSNSSVARCNTRPLAKISPDRRLRATVAAIRPSKRFLGRVAAAS